MKKIKQRIKALFKIIENINKDYLYIIGIALFILAPFMERYTIKGDDLYYHISNVYAQIKYLRNFGFMNTSKVLPVIAKNFGYGAGIFYPKLSHLAVLVPYLFLRIFGIRNIIFSIKIVYLFLFASSGIFMYKLMKKMKNDNDISLLSGILYITFPYFACDTFFRCSLAESFVFLFMPIILNGIISILEDDYYHFYICFIIGYVGMIYSHLVLSVYFTIFLLIILIINIKNIFTKRKIIAFIKASIFILIFISPFIIPMLEHKLLGNYMVFKDGIMVVRKVFIQDLRDIHSFFTLNNYSILSYITIILIYIVICNFKKIFAKKEKPLIISLIAVSFISIIMVTNIFPWKYAPSFMLNIQFSWRLQLFFGFFTSIIAGYCLKLIKNDNRRPLILIITIVLLTSYLSNVNLRDAIIIPENEINYSEYGMGWQHEYLPCNANKRSAYLYNRNENIKTIRGYGQINKIKNNTPYLSFEINNANNLTVEIPRLYYLGYNIKEKTNNKIINIDYKENKNGFIEFEIQDDGIIYINYIGTIGYRISRILCIISIIIYILYLTKLKKQNTKLKG